jgi:hypothetical protein
MGFDEVGYLPGVARGNDGVPAAGEDGFCKLAAEARGAAGDEPDGAFTFGLLRRFQFAGGAAAARSLSIAVLR